MVLDRLTTSRTDIHVLIGGRKGKRTDGEIDGQMDGRTGDGEMSLQPSI